MELKLKISTFLGAISVVIFSLFLSYILDARRHEALKSRTVYSLACSVLASALPENFFLGNSSTYNSSIQSYFSLQEQEVKAACVVRPHTTMDVSKTFQTLSDVFVHGGPAEAKFAIRSGGHSVFQEAPMHRTG